MTVLTQTPREIAELVAGLGGTVAIVRTEDGLRASHPEVEALRAFVDTDRRDAHAHEAEFLASGRRTGALLAAFVHWTCRKTLRCCGTWDASGTTRCTS